MMQEIELRTGVWYKDRSFILRCPRNWNVETCWPDTPLPLTDRQMEEKMSSPVGQPPLWEVAKGKKAPIVVVDDLTRPTPIFRIMPFLLKELRMAGIRPADIRILVATGTHGPQNPDALRNKLGAETVETCRVIVHDDQTGNRFVGKTSFGTSVYVDAEVFSSDIVIGIGGVYPQHTTGFGGGSKLVLGILGRRSIRQLHFRHAGVDGTYNINNNFRKDATEIARMVGMNTMYTLHVDARLAVVELFCGDHFAYYPSAAEFSRKRYDAPPPGNADVVIANCYPSDTSFNMMRKSDKPIRCASNGATKIMIGSLHEGIGFHGLFPQGGSSRIDAYRSLYNRISVMSGKEIVHKILHKVLKMGKGTPVKERERLSSNVHRENVWLFRPPGASTDIPPIPGVDITSDWEEILRVVQQRHGKQADIKVRIYPCAPLQCFDVEGPELSPAGE